MWTGLDSVLHVLTFLLHGKKRADKLRTALVGSRWLGREHRPLRGDSARNGASVTTSLAPFGLGMRGREAMLGWRSLSAVIHYSRLGI